MTTIRDVPADKLINLVSKELEGKTEFSPPEWAKFAKTGRHKIRPPVNKNWWYARLASILRTISLEGPVGVQRLRTKYGGSKRFKRQPKKSVKGSGNIIRKCIQQLEKAELVQVSKDKKGRVVTKKGESMLDKTAAKILKK